MLNKDNTYKLVKFIVVEVLFLFITSLLSNGGQYLDVSLIFSGFTLMFIL